MELRREIKVDLTRELLGYVRRLDKNEFRELRARAGARARSYFEIEYAIIKAEPLTPVLQNRVKSEM